MENKQTKFNLDDIIPAEDLKLAEEAGLEARKHREEIEWHRQNDPNFEQWYKNECQKMREQYEKRITHETIEEMIQKYAKYYRGL